MEFLKIIFSFSIMWTFYLRSYDEILGINLFLMCIFKTDEIENLSVQPRTKMGRNSPFLDTHLWKFDKGFLPHTSSFTLTFPIFFITLARVENHFYLIFLFHKSLFTDSLDFMHQKLFHFNEFSFRVLSSCFLRCLMKMRKEKLSFSESFECLLLVLGVTANNDESELWWVVN